MVHMCARAPTSHAIVREALTELIPHDKENREWKGPQLAELLHTIGIQDIVYKWQTARYRLQHNDECKWNVLWLANCGFW